jgi:hypothetical protein
VVADSLNAEDFRSAVLAFLDFNPRYGPGAVAAVLTTLCFPG